MPYSTDSKFPKLAYIKERGLHKYVNSRSQRSSRIIFRVCHITHVFGRSLIVAGLEQLASGKTKLAHRLETARLTAQGRDGLIPSPDAGAGAGAGAGAETEAPDLFTSSCPCATCLPSGDRRPGERGLRDGTSTCHTRKQVIQGLGGLGYFLTSLPSRKNGTRGSPPGEV